MSVSEYVKLETGVHKPDTLTRGILMHVSGPENYERCLLMRRRSGVTQAKVAEDLHRSRWWVNMMERGLVPCDDLLWYWES